MKTFPPQFKNPLIVALLLMALSIVAASPLLTEGWFITHEGTDPLYRVVALAEEIRHGDYYPRWLSLSYSGKGSPFFNFYSPVFYLTAAWLHVAGVPLEASIKLPVILLFFIGAWGMYLWTNRHYNPLGGGIAAVVYLFLPYHFVDVYVRGAFAEFTALAFLPYLFLGIDMTMDNLRSAWSIWLLALSASLLLLSHNLSALMIIPFALIYTCLFPVISLKKITMVAIGSLVGAGLSAFYWLPVITELQYLRNFDGSVSAGYYDYRIHFVYFDQLFSNFWGRGGSEAGHGDGMSFQVGVLLLILLSMMLVSLVFADRRQRQFPMITFILGILGLILTMDCSGLFYQTFPAFSFLQFPWRFLGPATFFLSASCGLIGEFAHARWSSAVLMIVTSLFAVYLSSDQRVVFANIHKDFDISTSQDVKKHSIGPLCAAHEYLPLWADLELAETIVEPKPYSSKGIVSAVKVSGHSMLFSFKSKTTQNTITVPWFYFPGWQVSANRRPYLVEPSREGFLSFTLPDGHHEVRIDFASTLPRQAGWIISCCTLLACLTFNWYIVRKKIY